MKSSVAHEAHVILVSILVAAGCARRVRVADDAPHEGDVEVIQDGNLAHRDARPWRGECAVGGPGWRQGERVDVEHELAGGDVDQGGLASPGCQSVG